ncbi:type II toxin-antitoxin system PemK/MazF family toxin [Lactobacillus sp. LL6]|uniref:type II toxin-antitoxin system PemK/MazF family toxin n=1 Tax=Lactobacillus sp. LL6 TaxID=2596827 RepID=UPI001186D9A9|nr:type II toxin-antitoxin system PemK/MazF family toxin [Lactobacillus sp. LL6]TSO25372.1 type II toxin-antitoxin system PemK/MazF family toxin [Lactobacillus sp. LL6]
MTKFRDYIPNKQDIVWIDFKPSIGQEIRGRHPAVVLSTSIYSELTGLVLVTPITHGTNNRLKDFFIPLTNLTSVEGYINPLQFYTFSYINRHIQFSGEILDDSTFALVQRRVREIVD